ncbi:MAG: hypothetical protein M0R33_17035 [Methylomonas sp.]|jgi:hypothetical protein|uniref:hypothetical protein n=1 Tax=Methylomonas sp. TaxID=418 RepID=UPI0025ED19F1|nr:hypothetical protein [Methylomonas sp.]MCK9608151.1 hypothetical protein [Methylomonas sp.]
MFSNDLVYLFSGAKLPEEPPKIIDGEIHQYNLFEQCAELELIPKKEHRFQYYSGSGHPFQLLEESESGDEELLKRSGQSYRRYGAELIELRVLRENAPNANSEAIFRVGFAIDISDHGTSVKYFTEHFICATEKVFPIHEKLKMLDGAITTIRAVGQFPPGVRVFLIIKEIKPCDSKI